jgi:hypothetical protein
LADPVYVAGIGIRIGGVPMSNADLYKPLLELSLAIKGCEEEIAENPGYFKKSKLKKQKDKLEGKLIESISDLINNSVESWESDQPLDLYLSDELEQIKEATDESWHPAIDDVKGRLLKVASSETKKSPLRRKIEKMAGG